MSLDGAIVHAVQDLRAPLPDAVFRLLSDARFLRVVGAVLLAVATYRRRSAAAIVAAAIALPTTALVTAWLKAAVGRARPPLADRTIHALVALPSDLSFPSGHASSTFAAVAVIAASLPRLRLPLLAAGALVAVSRVWLGVHYPSDVIVGAALGYGIGTLAVVVVRRLPIGALRETR